MSALRTSHDFERDVLRGMSLAAAREEAARLAAKANELTEYLARPRAGLTSVCRANVEAERDRYEWESHGISARVAEYLGQVERVREPVPARKRAAR